VTIRILDGWTGNTYVLGNEARPRISFSKETIIMATHKADSSNFEAEVLKSDIPVVVDFWAEWCGPCKMIAPSLEEISNEMDGKVKIAKLNMDENPELAAQYGVRSIPTLLMFKDGEPVAIQVGAAPKNKLSDWINSEV